MSLKSVTPFATQFPMGLSNVAQKLNEQLAIYSQADIEDELAMTRARITFAIAQNVDETSFEVWASDGDSIRPVCHVRADSEVDYNEDKGTVIIRNHDIDEPHAVSIDVKNVAFLISPDTWVNQDATAPIPFVPALMDIDEAIHYLTQYCKAQKA